MKTDHNNLKLGVVTGTLVLGIDPSAPAVKPQAMQRHQGRPTRSLKSATYIPVAAGLLIVASVAAIVGARGATGTASEVAQRPAVEVASKSIEQAVVAPASIAPVNNTVQPAPIESRSEQLGKPARAPVSSDPRTEPPRVASPGPAIPKELAALFEQIDTNGQIGVRPSAPKTPSSQSKVALVPQKHTTVSQASLPASDSSNKSDEVLIFKPRTNTPAKKQALESEATTPVLAKAE